MAGDNMSREGQIASGQNPDRGGPFKFGRRRLLPLEPIPSAPVQPKPELKEEPEVVIGQENIDAFQAHLQEAQEARMPRHVEIQRDAGVQRREYLEPKVEQSKKPKTYTRRAVIGGGLVATAAGGGFLLKDKIRKFFGFTVYAPGTASNPTERPATQAPATQEPATQVPTEVPATQAPTEVPATPKPELPLYPEKYNIGENNFRQYENGLFTGVEKGRAEETSQTYKIPWSPSNVTFEREPIKGLEINDPAGIEKALYIAEALWESKKGLATPEDFDKALVDYDNAVAAGETPVSKTRGLVFVDEPPVGFYTNHDQGFSKFTEKGEGGREVVEIFMPSGTVAGLQNNIGNYISVWCSANAAGMLNVSEAVTPNIEFTKKYIAPLFNKFRNVISSEPLILVP